MREIVLELCEYAFTAVGMAVLLVLYVMGFFVPICLIAMFLAG